jgi:hypothetical protein
MGACPVGLRPKASGARLPWGRRRNSRRRVQRRRVTAGWRRGRCPAGGRTSGRVLGRAPRRFQPPAAALLGSTPSHQRADATGQKRQGRFRAVRPNEPLGRVRPYFIMSSDGSRKATRRKTPSQPVGILLRIPLRICLVANSTYNIGGRIYVFCHCTWGTYRVSDPMAVRTAPTLPALRAGPSGCVIGRVGTACEESSEC